MLQRTSASATLFLDFVEWLQNSGPLDTAARDNYFHAADKLAGVMPSTVHFQSLKDAVSSKYQEKVQEFLVKNAASFLPFVIAFHSSLAPSKLFNQSLTGHADGDTASFSKGSKGLHTAFLV